MDPREYARRLDAAILLKDGLPSLVKAIEGLDFEGIHFEALDDLRAWAERVRGTARNRITDLCIEGCTSPQGGFNSRSLAEDAV